MEQKIESLESTMAREVLYKKALKRINQNPQAYGAINIETALLQGLVDEEDLKQAPNKELLAEAEIGWSVEDRHQGE